MTQDNLSFDSLAQWSARAADTARAETLTARERYLALLLTGPLLKSDAIVLLAGEDSAPRLDVAFQLFQQGAARTILVTGGLHEPPAKVGANELRATLIGKGVSPDRVFADITSLNTYDQAVHTVRWSIAEGWRRILLVASSYHLPRATLSFVKVLHESAHTETIRVVPVPASQSAWSASPEGVSLSRMELLEREAQKVEEYSAHVATYDEGIAYLQHWEGK